MTTARHLKQASLALGVLAWIGALQSARAEGTPASTVITNQASVSYSVNTIAQTPVTGQVSFVVDRRIRYTVAEVSGNATSVTPGQTNAVAAFSITSFTNAAQDFGFSITDEAGTTLFTRTDDINAPNLRAFVDAGVIGTYEPGTDTQTYVAGLAADTTVNVIVVADFPLSATNAQVANVRLTVRATTSGSSGATAETESPSNNQNGAPDVVIADTGRDNSELASDQYFVQSAALSVVKTSAVVSDPFNGASAPKAIPGATVRYTITVTNSGAQTATSVLVDDAIPANTAYVAGSITVNGSSVSDTGRTTGSPVSAISVDAGSVAGSGGIATVTFDVTINN